MECNETNATGWDEESEHMRSPLLTYGMGRRGLDKQVKDGSSLLTWHACQGYQTVRGKDGKQNRKEGTVLSQAGRARHVREPSVRDRLFLFVTVP